MIPTVTAAGHGQYGKALTVSLEQFLQPGFDVNSFFIVGSTTLLNIATMNGVVFGHTSV